VFLSQRGVCIYFCRGGSFEVVEGLRKGFIVNFVVWRELFSVTSLQSQCHNLISYFFCDVHTHRIFYLIVFSQAKQAFLFFIRFLTACV